MNEFLKNTLQAVVVTALTSVVSLVVAKKVKDVLDKRDENKVRFSNKTKNVKE